MYFFVKNGLGMRPGKVAGQVAHAAARLAKLIPETLWLEYLKHEVKYVYRVDEFPDVHELPLIVYYTIVIDQGLTQIEPNTETVMGIFTNYDLNTNRQYKLY